MKPEVVFGLENALWPALLIDAGGAILMFNTSASLFFGAGLEGENPQMASIWSPANGPQPPDFLAQWENLPTASVDLKFRDTDGIDHKFSTLVSVVTTEDDKWVLLQLLPPAAVIPPAPKPAEPPADLRNTTGDAALRQKLECVLQLARTVSLDFNNALTGVLAHTSLVLGKAEPNHPWRRSLLEVQKSAERAAEIASELAMFSRQEKESRRAPTGNLNAVASRCIEVFRNNAGPKIAFRLTQERSLYEARYDEAKVTQALSKVLENAVEAFSPGAQGEISVQTRNVQLTQPTQDRNVRLAVGTYVCIEITDNGTGIDDTALPRVFEPFFTTKRAPHRGLGLALVYGIVTNHGGGVAISSQVGKGTSARIYLPAEKTFVAESYSTASELRGNGTILVADDESLLLTMADAILSDFGYKVLTANTGQKALDILAQPNTKVNLLITDLVMPGLGGRELIERIRQQGINIPVIAMSGFVLPEEKHAHAGYLQKPFTSTDLLHKVKAALSLSQPA